MITVSIAIAVSVTVAVPASGTFRAVQYHAEVPETFLLIDVFQFGQHAAIQQAAAYHEDGTVRQFLDNLRVGHDVDGRTVYEDIVVLAAKAPIRWPACRPPAVPSGWGGRCRWGGYAGCRISCRQQ